MVELRSGIIPWCAALCERPAPLLTMVIGFLIGGIVVRIVGSGDVSEAGTAATHKASFTMTA